MTNKHPHFACLLKIIMLVIASTIVSACYTSSSEIYGADGKKAHRITCGEVVTSSFFDAAKCYEKSSQVCGARGYEVISEPIRGYQKVSIIIRCKDNSNTSSTHVPTTSQVAGIASPECVWDQQQAGGKGDATIDTQGRGNLVSNPSYCYQGGKRHGVWATKWHDKLIGDVVGIGTMRDGKENGSWAFYYADGTIAQGLAANGNEIGHWVVRRPDGAIIDVEYDNGNIVSSEARN